MLHSAFVDPTIHSHLSMTHRKGNYLESRTHKIMIVSLRSQQIPLHCLAITFMLLQTLRPYRDYHVGIIAEMLSDARSRYGEQTADHYGY
jgi:hypothetical protein